jgi:hypothetical protein
MESYFFLFNEIPPYAATIFHSDFWVFIRENPFNPWLIILLLPSVGALPNQAKISVTILDGLVTLLRRWSRPWN